MVWESQFAIEFGPEYCREFRIHHTGKRGNTIMRVKFWGTRGSIACPSPDHVRYGGNTSCVEIDLGAHVLILDAGTGIRQLGADVLKRGLNSAHILLTHTHWDHINGFPFFAPAYIPSGDYHVLAGHLRDMGGIQHVFARQMADPTFPVPLDAMQSKPKFEDFQAGDSLDIYRDVAVRTCPLNHPSGATAYRIDCAGRSVCYVTDTEHVPGQHDQNILGLIEGADLVIYDCTYTEDEFPSKIGWGHSTWNEGMALCRTAGARKLGIFHHDPSHDDAFMDRIAAEAQLAWPDGVVVCQDFMEINLD